MTDQTTHDVLKVPVPAGLRPATAEFVRQFAFAFAEKLHEAEQTHGDLDVQLQPDAGASA